MRERERMGVRKEGRKEGRKKERKKERTMYNVHVSLKHSFIFQA
jgi:hypothetical protein